MKRERLTRYYITRDEALVAASDAVLLYIEPTEAGDGFTTEQAYDIVIAIDAARRALRRKTKRSSQ